MKITKDDLTKQRALYMSGKITHEQYYCWIADSLGISITDLHPKITLKRIRESTDPHLNDIPLALWDAQHHRIKDKASKLPWALGDTVCVLKAFARREAFKPEWSESV